MLTKPSALGDRASLQAGVTLAADGHLLFWQGQTWSNQPEALAPELQAAVADRIGTSRSRLNSYLAGKVTPSMDVLVAVEDLAREVRAPSLSAILALR